MDERFITLDCLIVLSVFNNLFSILFNFRVIQPLKRIQLSNEAFFTVHTVSCMYICKNLRQGQCLLVLSLYKSGIPAVLPPTARTDPGILT